MCIQLSSISLILLLSLFISRLPCRLGPLYHNPIWGTARMYFGPSSFPNYIDDLTYLPISSGSHSVLYTDDLLLFRPEDIQHLQDDISTIDKWVQQNHLTFNSFC